MKKIVNSEVDTPDGKATLKEIYVTELGYIMAKLFFTKKKVFVNYKIGDIKKMMQSNNIDIISEWTKSIKIEEKLAI